VAYATDHVAPDADVPGRARFPRLGTGGARREAYPGDEDPQHEVFRCQTQTAGAVASRGSVPAPTRPR
jgi:hypothetical protein